MKILFAASECVPFIKTGGLADVVGSLPVELKRLGEDARVILPKYRAIDGYWRERMEHVCDFYMIFGWAHVFCGVERVVDNGVTYYFVDNEEYFAVDGIYGDGEREGVRFAFFCRAVLEIMPRIGFFPDVLHLNDWQTGMIAALLKTQYQGSEDFRRVRTVFSIHNLKYQGIFNWKEMAGRLAVDERYNTPEYLEFYGSMSFLKGGLVFSDRILTVSPSYADEIRTPYYGEQLDGLMRARGDSLSGILNGIDNTVYDPATDRFLAAHFSSGDLAGKAENKRLLQRECGLDERPDVPVIGMIARLTPQKGLDLIERVLGDMMQTDVQLVFLGKGDKRFVDLLNWANWRYQRRLHARIALDEGLAHRIYAGADMFLMPSQFEPCGLSQMIALRYGAIPIVRETGGLRDTIRPYNKYTDEGNGFSFANYNAHEMLHAIQSAVGYYWDDKPMWARLVQRAMACDFSWTHSAQQYCALYRTLLPAPEAQPAAAETAAVATAALETAKPETAAIEAVKAETATPVPAEAETAAAPGATEATHTPAPAVPRAAAPLPTPPPQGKTDPGKGKKPPTPPAKLAGGKGKGKGKSEKKPHKK